MRTIAVAILSLLGMAAVACGSNPPSATSTPLATHTPAATDTPYPPATSSPPPTSTPTPSTGPEFVTTQVGTIMNEPGSFQGYTLFTSGRQNGTAYLIDNEGRIVHTWPVNGSSAQLMENGDLLVAKTTDGSDGVSRLAPDGSVLWDYDLDEQHHDFIQMPNGNVMILSRESKTFDEAVAAGANPACVGEDGLDIDYLVEVRPTGPTEGEIIWRWAAWDHLIQDFDPSKPNHGVVAEHPELIDINFRRCGVYTPYYRNPDDWIHANSISYHPELDQILISARNLGEVWIIDHSVTLEEAAGHTGGRAGKGGDLLYRWGNPQAYRAGSPADQQLFWAHDAQWIEPGLPGAGNIIIFNNGDEYDDARRGYSSIEELTPPLDGFDYRLEPGSAYGPAQPTWQYVGEPPSDFYSARQSGVQRLPNGNTLICSGFTGTFFEVTPQGKTVWKYVSPVIYPEAGESPLRQGDPMPIRTVRGDGAIQWQNQVYRAYRYAPDYPGLRALDLTPGDPIERYE